MRNIITMMSTVVIITATGVALTAQEKRTLSMAYPTGDRDSSILLIEAEVPEQARAGSTIATRVTVTNLTENTALHNVTLTPQTSKGVEIRESGEQGGNSGNRGDGSNNTTPNGQSSTTGRSQNALRVGKLMPGDSKTLNVDIVGDNVGDGMACLAVTYRPVMCLNIKFVKPELQITKKAAEEIDMCRDLTVNYTVKNTGSGEAEGVVIRENLPSGFATTDGKNRIQIKVGDLGAGESAKSEVVLVPQKKGTFDSRAMAESANGLKATSNRTSTKVTAVDLKVAINGPSEEEVGDPMKYEITVTNNGDAPSMKTQLNLEAGETARVVRATQEGLSGDAKWDLGTIEPGDSKTVSVTVMANEQGEINIKAVATAACGRGEDARDFARTEAETKTALSSFPALLLYVVDSDDNLDVGSEVTYKISVLNQGKGADENLRLTVELPEQLKFVEARGASNASADGTTITFKPVDQIKGGQRLDWELVCKAEEAGDLRTRVEMNSNYLSEPVPDVEPTRVID